MSIWPVSTFYSFGMRCDIASEDITEAYKLQEMALPLGPEILIQKLWNAAQLVKWGPAL